MAVDPKQQELERAANASGLRWLKETEPMAMDKWKHEHLWDLRALRDYNARPVWAVEGTTVVNRLTGDSYYLHHEHCFGCEKGPEMRARFAKWLNESETK